MSEAAKYTAEMWQRHLGSVVQIVNGSETKRRAFIAGFNGETDAGVHHTAREAWERGRHSSVLLGYLPANPSEGNHGQ